MRSRITLTLLATTTLLLAGCTTDGEGEGEGFELDTYALSTTGMPASATVNESFEFELMAVGELDATSTHIGAHYWSYQPTDPTADLGDARACVHPTEERDVPGSYTATCTIGEVGTWYVYGHLRITDDGVNHEYWADGEAVEVGLVDLP